MIIWIFGFLYVNIQRRKTQQGNLLFKESPSHWPLNNITSRASCDAKKGELGSFLICHVSIFAMPADHLRKRCYGNDNCNCNGNYQWLQAVLEWVIRLLGTLGRVGGEDNSNRRARAIQRNMPPDSTIIFNTLAFCFHRFNLTFWQRHVSDYFSVSVFTRPLLRWCFHF